MVQVQVVVVVVVTREASRNLDLRGQSGVHGNAWGSGQRGRDTRLGPVHCWSSSPLPAWPRHRKERDLRMVLGSIFRSAKSPE